MQSLLSWHGFPCWLQLIPSPFRLFLKCLFVMRDKPQALWEGLVAPLCWDRRGSGLLWLGCAPRASP